MEPITIQTDGAPVIRIGSIGDRLQVRSWESHSVQVYLEDEDQPKAEAVGGEIRISSPAGCQLFVPTGSRIEAELIRGDASVQGVTGDVLLRRVGGDLRLREVGATAVETVGGNLTARSVTGNLSVDRTGGDALADGITGDVRLRGVGGDLRISRIGGLVQAEVGGDARLSLAPVAGTHSVIEAGGDLVCSLPENASAKVEMTAGGDLHLAVPVESKPTEGGHVVQLGDGSATLELTAGGDLSLRSGIEGFQGIDIDLGGAIADRVGAEIEAHLTEIEGRIGSLGERLGTFDADRIGRKIRETIAKAQRKAARAQMRAASIRAESMRPDWSAESGGNERIAVLRMLEAGKLTVAQAEELLSALES